MDWQGIVNIVSSIGFPIVMCLLMGFYIKYITDEHKEEISQLKTALDNNTVALTKLIERLGGN